MEMSFPLGVDMMSRFNNPSNQQYLYYYADDFQAVAVQVFAFYWRVDSARY